MTLDTTVLTFRLKSSLGKEKKCTLTDMQACLHGITDMPYLVDFLQSNSNLIEYLNFPNTRMVAVEVSLLHKIMIDKAMISASLFS